MKTLQEIRDMVARNEISKALQALKPFTSNDNSLDNELILQTSRFNSNERDKNLNIADPAHINIEHNRIVYALLKLVEKLQEDVQNGKSTNTNIPNNDNIGRNTIIIRGGSNNQIIQNVVGSTIKIKPNRPQQRK